MTTLGSDWSSWSRPSRYWREWYVSPKEGQIIDLRGWKPCATWPTRMKTLGYITCADENLALRDLQEWKIVQNQALRCDPGRHKPNLQTLTSHVGNLKTSRTSRYGLTQLAQRSGPWKINRRRWKPRAMAVLRAMANPRYGNNRSWETYCTVGLHIYSKYICIYIYSIYIYIYIYTQEVLSLRRRCVPAPRRNPILS